MWLSYRQTYKLTDLQKDLLITDRVIHRGAPLLKIYFISPISLMWMTCRKTASNLNLKGHNLDRLRNHQRSEEGRTLGYTWGEGESFFFDEHIFSNVHEDSFRGYRGWKKKIYKFFFYITTWNCIQPNKKMFSERFEIVFCLRYEF